MSWLLLKLCLLTYMNYDYMFRLTLTSQWLIINNKKQLLLSNNLSLEIKKKLKKKTVFGVLPVCGSETATLVKIKRGP